MWNRTCRRFAPTVLVATLLTTGVLVGCTDSDSPPRTSGPGLNVTVDGISVHDGRVCPKKLPQRPGPGGSLFGTDRSAEVAPVLQNPESAWVCEYDRASTSRGQGKNNIMWTLVGSAQPIASTHLPALTRSLAELAPARQIARRVCPADLGPRWMLAYTHDGAELTGVVIDDFGCEHVRLTDNPFETVPGDADQRGAVPGVLTAPAKLLDELKRLHES